MKVDSESTASKQGRYGELGKISFFFTIFLPSPPLSLRNLITGYSPPCIITSKVLKYWRQKIRKWSKSLKKPKRWKQWLRENDKLKAFKDKVIKTLKNMSLRSFCELQNKIREILEDLSKEENLNYSEMQEVTLRSCSRDWWCRFMDENQDIRDLWEDLPVKSSHLQKTFPGKKFA